jgi:hypothetical protein
LPRHRSVDDHLGLGDRHHASLIARFDLSSAEASWLTNMVQLGFVAGALLSSVVSLPDLVSLRRLMSIAGVLAALANVTLYSCPRRLGYPCITRHHGSARLFRDRDVRTHPDDAADAMCAASDRRILLRGVRSSRAKSP